MPAKGLLLFQCDNCNYSDSFDLTKLKDVTGIVPMPPGWWTAYDTTTNRLKIFCAGNKCSREKLGLTLMPEKKS